MITLKIGDVAPEFSAINQDGKMINLTDYKGKKVVTVFLSKRQYAWMHDPILQLA